MSSGTILDGKQNFPKEAHVFPLYNLSIVSGMVASLLNCIHILIVEGDLLRSFYREIVFIISHPTHSAYPRTVLCDIITVGSLPGLYVCDLMFTIYISPHAFITKPIYF